jgi:hypothetical protein
MVIDDGGPLFVGMTWQPPDTYHSGRHRAGDHHLNFYGSRTSFLAVGIRHKQAAPIPCARPVLVRSGLDDFRGAVQLDDPVGLQRSGDQFRSGDSRVVSRLNRRRVKLDLSFLTEVDSRHEKRQRDRLGVRYILKSNRHFCAEVRCTGPYLLTRKVELSPGIAEAKTCRPIDTSRRVGQLDVVTAQFVAVGLFEICHDIPYLSISSRGSCEGPRQVGLGLLRPSRAAVGRR